MNADFRAPWSATLKLSTSLFFGLLAAICFITDGIDSYLIAAILLLSLFLSVTGYSVRDGTLMVHRLLWRTRLDLDQLSGIEIQPYITNGSIRLFGIGGLFASVGNFRNQALGSYRAYITDPKNAVVLDFNGEIVVVTPADPLAFERAIWQARRSQSS
jgi:hypothetical protein